MHTHNQSSDSRLDTETESSSPIQLSPTRVVSGEVYIDPLESEGLPAAVGGRPTDGVTDADASDVYEKRSRVEASRLVRAHARGMQFLAGMRGGLVVGKTREDEKGGADVDTTKLRLRRKRSNAVQSNSNYNSVDENDIDIERDALKRNRSHSRTHTHTTSPNATLGTGVLSSLLALYNQQGTSSRSGFSTPSTEYASDADLLEGGTNIDGGGEDGKSKGRKSKKGVGGGGKRRGKHIRGLFVKSKESGDEIAQTTSTTSTSQTAPTLPNPFTTSTTSGTSTPQRICRKLESLSDSINSALLTSSGHGRPVQARNAGGVFGTLITSTGNLSGAAAPGPSSVAPNVTRPGYHLARYSLSGDPEVDARELRVHAAAAAGAATSYSQVGSRRGSVVFSEKERVGEEELSAMSTNTNTAPSTPPKSGAQTPAEGVHHNHNHQGQRMDTTGSGSGVKSRRSRWGDILSVKDFASTTKLPWMTPMTNGGSSTEVATPSPETGSEGEWLDEKSVGDLGGKEERRKRKRKKAEIFVS